MNHRVTGISSRFLVIMHHTHNTVRFSLYSIDRTCARTHRLQRGQLQAPCTMRIKMQQANRCSVSSTMKELHNALICTGPHVHTHPVLGWRTPMTFYASLLFFAVQHDSLVPTANDQLRGKTDIDLPDLMMFSTIQRTPLCIQLQ